MRWIRSEAEAEVEARSPGDLARPPHSETPLPGAWALGVVRTLGVLFGFAAFGMGWASLESVDLAARPSTATYPGDVPEPPETSDPPAVGATPEVWLVDGFNVLHASLLGGRDRTKWWSEARRGEVLALVRSLQGVGGEIWVVFDGPRPAPDDDADPSPVRQVFAPSADEWLLRRVRESEAPGRVAVVTGDRRLAGRARHRGALVVSPGEFLARFRRASGDAPEPA